MQKSDDPYDRSVRSLNNADSYEFSGESEYSRDRSDPYQMVDYMLDHGVEFRDKKTPGFHFTDANIHEDVLGILARDSRIDLTAVDVTVKNGIVHLIGLVDSRQTKRLAEIMVENLPGVNDVVNQLRF